jgi:acetyl esterase
MPLDPAAANLLELLAQAEGPPLEQLTPTQARQTFAALADLGGPGAVVASAENLSIGGIPALVVTPIGETPMPVLVWIHGGGWVVGSPEESASTAKDLAAAAGCIVVSVDYRLAPEHPAPAAFEDCVITTAWLLDHAAEIGGDPQRIAVGGDSAGGHLAAQVALQFGKRLRYQVLVYPVTDLTLSSASIEENAEGYLLTKAAMQWFVHHYLNNSGLTPEDPLVSPLHAADATLASAPAAFVITAEFDPLRDEGEAYAERLRAVGVDVTQRRFDGQIHAFYGMSMMIPDGADAISHTADLLRAAFE